MYDLGEIKSIPLADVASRYGIKLEQKHNRLWGKIRPEESASSFSINLAKNLWYDFGAFKGGSTIDLVMELEGINKTEAINKLAEAFCINNEVVNGWSPLTDYQYRILGVDPINVTLNFNYDLRVHTIDQLKRWNSKYSMSIQKLASMLPEKYNMLVNKIGQKTINSIKDAYSIKIKTAVDPLISKDQQSLYKAWAVENAIEINSLVELLSRAIKEDSIGSLKKIVPAVKALAVNPEKDMAKLSKISKTKEAIEGEQVRNDVIEVYKSFNLPFADYFTVAAAKALLEFNKSFNDGFMPVEKIKSMYKIFGDQLCVLEDMYSKQIQKQDSLQNIEGLEYKACVSVTDSLKHDLQDLRELFKKASAAIDGLRDAGIKYKNDMAAEMQESKIHDRTKEGDLAIIE